MVKFLLAAFVIAIAYVGFESFRLVAAGPGLATEQVTFEVPAGVSFRQVATNLEEKGLVWSALRLRIYAKITGEAKAVKTGEYALNRAMTPKQILAVLVSGKSIQYPVTFPEGANIYEMAATLNGRGLYQGEEFLKLAHDQAFIKQVLGQELPSLEGYLFPETYNVTKFTPLKEFVTGMVQNFKTNYAALEADAKAKGHEITLPRHGIVTLASIVEKETGAGEERPLIASIFFNRLKKNMRLQSDPTIIYGIWVATGAYKANITKEDLLKPTDYNTYTVARLPAGPISNPGRESLAAAINPATSEYLYFVSKNNGTHIFTKTYEDHLKAVKSFQLDPAAREGHSWRELKKASSGP